MTNPIQKIAASNSTRIGLVSLAGLALVVLSGCGSNGPHLVSVKGAVKYQGKPVDKGTITFYPVSGKAVTSGAEIKGGEYHAQIPVGEMKVTISAPKVVGKRKLYQNDPKSPEIELTDEALPARYNKNSQLTISVNDDVVEKDFELTK